MVLHQPVLKIENDLECKKVFLSVFLDIEGAFDNTTTQSNIEVALSHEIEEITSRWLKTMFQDKIVKSSMYGGDVDVVINKGVHREEYCLLSF